MIDSTAWTGLRSGRKSIAVDFYRLTPKWLWRTMYHADAIQCRLFPSVIVTREALLDSP